VSGFGNLRPHHQTTEFTYYYLIIMPGNNYKINPENSDFPVGNFLTTKKATPRRNVFKQSNVSLSFYL